MTGEKVKQILDEMRCNYSAIAREMGVLPQNVFSIFTSPDVKSGLLEKLAKIVGKDMSLFYPEVGANITNSNNQAGRDISINSADAIKVGMLERENEQLRTQCEQLTAIITNLTRPNR